MATRGDLLSVIDDMLTQLTSEHGKIDNETAPTEPLPSLLKHCKDACAELEATEPEPMRAIHHFACTGGTLMSRCIEAMPNTVLLSEIDPFSTLPLRAAQFAPYDLLRQSQTSLRPLDEGGVVETFLAGLEAIYNSNAEKGRRVVIRDHTHSHFCTGVDPAQRPLMRDILVTRFPILSIVTVRHPLDSFVSLRKNGWIMFEPDTLEEYCQRYLLFLDAYADTPVFRYEDFVANPDSTARMIVETLGLHFVGHWRDLLPVIKISGDSGRKSDDISLRTRRKVDEGLAAECQTSGKYNSLCARLGFNPAPDALPVVANLP